MTLRLLLVCCFTAVLLSSFAAGSSAESVADQVKAYFAMLPPQLPMEGTPLGDGIIVFRLTGEGGGVWHIDIAKGKLTVGEGEVENPRAAMEVPAADWLMIARGEVSPMVLYMAGTLKITGDLEFLQGFGAKMTAAQSQTGENVKTDTTGWYQFTALKNDYAQHPASDTSDLLDAPAGKHGFLTVKGDQFVFADGTPVKFWGTNIVAGNVFMDHATAERTAARLARFGCNMVRFHHMDASWAHPNIFDQNYDDTQHLSAESLDRLDYLMAQLKQRGIYIYLDLLVHRKFKAGDEVRDWKELENGAKIAAHYNLRLIELQKQYAHDLYTHKNPYTGLRYCDDPAIVLSEIINESSLFWDNYDMLPASYVDEINTMYAKWAKRHDGPPITVSEGLEQRDAKVLQFLYETQVAYFTGMRDYLRSIGVKVPIAGSNFWESMAFDLKSNMELDYLDRHNYWDHPQGGYGPEARFDNRPMVKGRDWNLISGLAPTQAIGKPVIITEWNTCWINDYIAEGPLTMVAYGAYQGWDGLLQFDYGGGGDWPNHMDSNFSISEQPHVFATWPAAARLFRQVKPGELYDLKIAAEDVARGAYVHAPPQLSLLRRLAFSFSPEPVKLAVPTTEGPAVSDTQELVWDQSAGLLTANTPQSAVHVGFSSGPVKVGLTTFNITSDFSVVAVNALDGKSLPDSRHMLITATARAENSGMVFAPGRRSAIEAGHAPILMQPVRGDVKLTFPASPLVTVWALDSAGNRLQQITPKREGPQTAIPLEADTFWYEVEVKLESDVGK